MKCTRRLLSALTCLTMMATMLIGCTKQQIELPETARTKNYPYCYTCDKTPCQCYCEVCGVYACTKDLSCRCQNGICNTDDIPADGTYTESQQDSMRCREDIDVLIDILDPVTSGIDVFKEIKDNIVMSRVCYPHPYINSEEAPVNDLRTVSKNGIHKLYINPDYNYRQQSYIANTIRLLHEMCHIKLTNDGMQCIDYDGTPIHDNFMLTSPMYDVWICSTLGPVYYETIEWHKYEWEEFILFCKHARTKLIPAGQQVRYQQFLIQFNLQGNNH